MQVISQETFINLFVEAGFDVKKLSELVKQRYPELADARPYRIAQRVNRLRSKGLLPLESGNFVESGQDLKSTSTLYDAEGNIKLQWVKSDAAKETQLQHILESISEAVVTIPSLPSINPPKIILDDNLVTLYISNDVHLGALMWGKESGSDWNTEMGQATLYSAYDYLFSTSPNSKFGIIADLGDLLEADNSKNMTPKSGNILAVDSRYPKVLRLAYEALIYAISKALTKHEYVFFYNISGNHDIESSHAIREVIRMAFIDEPRVIIDDNPSTIKYHQHGSVLLQFAHGDGMRMKQAGEVMAVDQQSIFSSTKHRFSHMGHNHVDSVYDGPICRVESHRNIAPNNHWAHNMGYRRSLGTMKSITYHADKGEVSRSIFNID